VKSDFLNSII
jgi:hypothetical protein